MWRSLKNFFYSVWTYADLSPNIKLRRRVNKSLRRRINLSATEWYEAYWQPLDITRPISDFVYTQMQSYSGLVFGRVHPTDRLNEDLHLALICWFDWETSFCESFLESFGVDIFFDFNPDNFATVQELVLFLNQQLLLTNCY